MNRCAIASREQCRPQHKSKAFLRKEKQKPKARVPVTASIAWPTSIERWTKGRQSGGSTGCNENTQLAPSAQKSLNQECGWKGGDRGPLGGKEKTVSNEKTKTLT